MATKTIGAAGDYTTIALWSAYVKALGATLSADETGELIDDAVYSIADGTNELQFTEAFANGFTITLKGTGSGLYNHATGAGARLSINNNFAHVMRIREGTVIEDLYATNTSTGGYGILTYGGVVRRVVVESPTWPVDNNTSGGSTATIESCLLVAQKSSNARGVRTTFGDNITLINNTIISEKASSGYGLELVSSDTLTGNIYNNVITGFGTDVSSSATTLSLTTVGNNAGDAASIDADSFDTQLGGTGNVVLSGTPFLSAGTGDYTPIALGQLENAGQVTTASTDLYGNLWSSPPSIGAIESAGPAPSVDDVNADEIVLDAESGCTFTTANFAGEITGVSLVNGTYSLAMTSVTSTSGAGTFAVPDIAAMVGLNTVVPFGAIDFSLTDGTETRTLAGTLSPKAGYSVTIGASISTITGSLAENFNLDAGIPNSPADGTQFYFPQGVGDGQLILVNPDGTFTTNSTTNVPVQVGWDDAGTWRIKNFSVVVGVGADTTPNAFSFTDQTSVPLSTVTESNTITVTGIDSTTSISVDSGEYRINAGTWVSASGTVSLNDTVQLRHTSSGTNSTAVNQILTIGGVTDTFTTTTEVAPGMATLSGDAKISLSLGISL